MSRSDINLYNFCISSTRIRNIHLEFGYYSTTFQLVEQVELIAALLHFQPLPNERRYLLAMPFLLWSCTSGSRWCDCITLARSSRIELVSASRRYVMNTEAAVRQIYKPLAIQRYPMLVYVVCYGFLLLLECIDNTVSNDSDTSLHPGEQTLEKEEDFDTQATMISCISQDKQNKMIVN